MNLINILEKLKKYPSPIFKSIKGLNNIEIDNLEQKLKYQLPKDFKEFLLITNGAIINCHEVFGIVTDKPFEDLYGNYLFEKEEVENPKREYLLPIYPDGMGNHNCLDLSTLSEDGETCNVIFWQHDWFYKPEEQPDIDANSFTEYLEKLLIEITEQYNYDGTEK